MRAVLDPNVLISAVLSSRGAPADVLRAAARGEFEVVLSAALLAELERALAYPKLRARVAPDDAADYLAWVAALGVVADDPDQPPPVRSPDPGDDCLIALAAAERCGLVSGGSDMLGLAGRIPVFTAREWLELLRAPRQPPSRA
ncbi:MAG: putative toxin-antitoxin system toxin component, PIN family [Solirubrobacteraceae bacterium]